MEASSTELPQSQYNLQEYLSLGYIYLVILGIIDEVIYYNFFGVDILNYSSISDVLIAPINTLLSDIRVFVAVVVFMSLAYLSYIKLIPALYKKVKGKSWYQKMVKDADQADAKFAAMQRRTLLFMTVYLSCMFLGLRIGYGYGMKESIDKGDFKLNHILTLNDNSSKQVRIIGQNSLYVFYITKEQREVAIMPISGNIKEIRKSPK
ncbi:hypothetical protein [Haliscomenobacter sp.]|uniref:hypothetical protein n=1 Tax=Haliscomenobacter sp. TaxID=2717303 RepID=UPI0035934FF7